MKKLVKSAALLTTLLGTAATMAGEPEMMATPMPAPEPESKFSGSLSLDLNSHFVSYGQDVWGDGNSFNGGTWNPSLELTWALPADFTFILGTWWDVNGKVPSAIGGKIQEIDVWAGLGYSIGDFSITALYQNWMYASGNEQIVDINLSYDCFLSPSLTIHNRVDPGASGGNNGTVLVAGIEYGFDAGPVSIAFPLNVAYFLEDDFHVGSIDSGYGYTSFGVTASIPISFIGDEYGEWDIHGGLIYYTTEDSVVGNVRSGRPENNFLTGNIGIGCSF